MPAYVEAAFLFVVVVHNDSICLHYLQRPTKEHFIAVDSRMNPNLRVLVYSDVLLLAGKVLARSAFG